MRPTIITPDQRFTRLIAIKLDTSKEGLWWICKCDCGNFISVRAYSLANGDTQSCGCLHSEIMRTRNTTHNKSFSPEYNSWCGMIQRCTNPNSHKYSTYGGRGISVCERWLNSFENFYVDMGPKPGAEYTIDRENNNGHYEPNNCRWATKMEQSSNRSNNILIEGFDGVKTTLSQAARDNGLSFCTLKYRLNKGMTINKALTTPIDKSKQGSLKKYGY